MRMRAAALLASLAWATGAAAQQTTLDPSPVVACLTPPVAERGQPVYPPTALQRNSHGRVKVELEFTTPDLRPAVRVLESEGGEDFEGAVRDHVRRLRVPCLTSADIPARLIQDYVFRPDDRKVFWSQPQDSRDDGRRQLMRCMRHESGERSLSYPEPARRAGTQGRVLARLSFDAPDRPPQVELFARDTARPLVRAVERWASGYRLPCHVGAPIRVMQTYVFVLGDDVYGFRPVSLPTLMGGVRGLDRTTLKVDTTTMGCPFELKFSYHRPHLPNSVGEVGSIDLARRELIEWLAGIELALPERSLDSVFGDSVIVTVPCVKIDLKPKE